MRTGAPGHRRTVGSAHRPLRARLATVARLWACAPVAVAAACGDDRPDAVAAVAAAAMAADSADQLIIGMTHYITENGVRKAYLEADTAFFYENTGRAELRRVRVTFFGPSGDTSSVVTSRLGSYETRTSRMEAREDVVVVLSNGGRLTTSVLRYDQARNEVSTDQHYVYVGPDQNTEGEGFVTDPALSTIRTSRPRGTVGSVVLPGQ